MPQRPTSPTRASLRPWHALVIVLLVSCVLCLPFLGASGLAHAEGQRVQPAWAMLQATRDVAARDGVSFLQAFFTRDSLDAWLVPHLFEQAYLRKPPGTPWAIATFGAIFGETNAAARAMSGCALVLMSLLTALTAARWFGDTPRRRAQVALAAGLAAALFPAWCWYPPLARSAEIESLNHLWTFIASIAIVELMLAPRHTLSIAGRITSLRRTRTLAWTLVLACAAAALFLTKGPAGLPVLAGVGAACAVMRGRLHAPTHAACASRLPVGFGLLPVCVALAAGVLVFGAWSIAAKNVLARTGEVAITQEVSEFLFSPQRLLEILALPIAALLTALPHSLSMLRFAGPATREGLDPVARARHILAQTICLGVICSIIVYMAAGVSNNRYVLPAMTLLPLVVAASFGRAAAQRELEPARPATTARFAWTAAVLFVLALGLAVYGERRREGRTSGEPDAIKLGALLAGPAELWGDSLLDMRPEIAMRAAREAALRGQPITPRWTPHVLAPKGQLPVPPVGGYLLVRTDRRGGTTELEAYRQAGLLTEGDSSFAPVFEGKAHNFEYVVYRRLR
jgi:4-amino-4-deoxy-L-arabinose transferase-like glycosyltransferase